MARRSSSEPDFSDYARVSERITLFYQRYPNGRIITRLHSRTNGQVTFRALVFRWIGDAKAAATGWASERVGDGEINEVACLENTETSAVGRALANLGFTASTRRPSREEMEKTDRERARLTARPAMVSETAPFAHPSLDAHPLQQRANVVHDVLNLLQRAEAIGFSPPRSARLRTILRHQDIEPARLARVERRLRLWIARHRTLLA